MEAFPANSHSSKGARDNRAEIEKKTDEKKVTRVVEGEVVRRKKPLGRRFMETFIGGDTKGVWSYVLFDVLIPAAKDMAADAVSQGIERMLFGEVRSTSRRGGYRPGGSNTYVSYNRYSSSSNPIVRRHEERRSISPRSRAMHDFQEIILATRPEAELVIERLFDLVDKYNHATVADLYDLVGVSSEYTDNNFGWTDIRGASVVRVSNGYLLDLPRPEPIRD
jgi:hypothetical protein